MITTLSLVVALVIVAVLISLALVFCRISGDISRYEEAVESKASAPKPTAPPETDRCRDCQLVLGDDVSCCFVMGRSYCLDCYNKRRDEINRRAHV